MCWFQFVNSSYYFIIIIYFAIKIDLKCIFCCIFYELCFYTAQSFYDLFKPFRIQRPFYPHLQNLCSSLLNRLIWKRRYSVFFFPNREPPCSTINKYLIKYIFTYCFYVIYLKSDHLEQPKSDS